MNYQQIYNNLITAAFSKNRVKSAGLERHHILPKSMGGKNTIDNIVYMTTREHFIAHRLLVKITKGDATNHKKMIYALWWMSKTRHNSNGNIVTSRTYEHCRDQYSKHNPNKDVIRKQRFIENRKAGIYKYDDKKMGITLRNTLKSMSTDDMQQRMQNSVRSCDDVKRGNSISKGKSSILELTKTTGEIIIFSTTDNVVELAEYSIQKLIYHIKRHDGLLPNGNSVKYIQRYSGNDSRIGYKVTKHK